MKWENNGSARPCVLNELLRGRARQKCKSSSLAVNYDLFIHCNKEDGSSR